jgi:glycosyltransferase involved in cell wall biosynthesis
LETALLKIPRMNPSFSLVLETENLETADIKGLQTTIASLSQQGIDQANEVLLIDSGNTPAPLLAQLQQIYPWLTVKTAPPNTEYYASKMLGLEWTTGDIIVYYDSDCVYDRNWLTSLLAGFNNPEIQVIGGETTTDGVGFYGTAMALCYIFPQYSGLTDLMPVKQYFLNNVAFRRSLLESIPIPTGLPLYRGNCVLHAQQLIAAGYTIWREPKARSLHAPPNGFKHYWQRFVLIGHDWYWQQRLTESPPASKLGGVRSSDDPTITQQSKLSIGFDRISKMIARDRRHAFYLPFCLPIVMVSVLLIAIGYQITVRHPHYLRDRLT